MNITTVVLKELVRVMIYSILSPINNYCMSGKAKSYLICLLTKQYYGREVLPVNIIQAEGDTYLVMKKIYYLVDHVF
jgi:hypothetical protein